VNASSEKISDPKFIENSLLVSVGLLAHMPLYIQLPRWAYGLDPTFVPPSRIPSFSPFALHMVAIHPLIWIAITIATLVLICRNYGWTLAKRCPLPPFAD